jgi:sulfatase maturation enzyme AslB (radical SAM superfamily)
MLNAINKDCKKLVVNNIALVKPHYLQQLLGRNLCTGGCHHENLVTNGTTRTPEENYCMTTRADFHDAMHLYLHMTDEQKKVFLGA